MIPAAIEALFRDGSIAYFAIGILAAEVLCLLLLARRPALPVIANGLSGAFLILALRSAILGNGIPEIAIWLGLGGLAHLADLFIRLRS